MEEFGGQESEDGEEEWYDEPFAEFETHCRDGEASMSCSSSWRGFVF